MKDVNVPANDGKSVSRYVRGLTENRVPHTLDFSDDRQWSFFMEQVTESGVTAESHPQFYQSLLDSRDRHVANGGPTATPEALYGASFAAVIGDSLQNTNQITALSFDTLGINSIGSAFSAIVGGTISTYLSVRITDSVGNLLGSGSVGPIYGLGQYIPIDITGNVPNTPGLQMQFSYSYQVPGQFPVQQTVSLLVLDQPIGPPTVTQPVKQTTNPAHPTFLKIGIGRDQAHTPADCDYYYYEPNINNPNIRCPMVGSQTFGSAITTPLFDGSSPTANLVVNISMSQTSLGGAVQVLPIQMANLQNYITASGNTLSWNFPWNSGVYQDLSMMFGPAAWAEDTTLMLSFSLGVLTQLSPTIPVYVNVISLPAGPAGSPPAEGNWGTSPGPGQYIMYPIFYTWHCVAAGTQVRLADGTTRAIEQLTGGERLKNGPDANTFTVVDTWGRHDDHELVALTVAGGEKLLLTGGHPVMTANGLMAAKNLKAGDVVLTESGPVALTSAVMEPYSGLLYTVSVGIDEAELAQFTDDNTCIYANGILIGDHRATLIYQREQRFGLESVLSRLPAEWHDEARRWYPKQREQLQHLANLGITR